MRQIIVALCLLLAAPAVWSAVGCTVYTRSSDGDDADDGSTWALANATLAGSIADWTTGDIICIEDNHSESPSSTTTYSSSNDGYTDWIPIYLVSDADDSYSPTSSTAQITVTGSGNDLNFQGWFSVFGVGFAANDQINWVAEGVTAFYGVDAYFDIQGDGVTISVESQQRAHVELKNSEVNFSHANGGRLAISNGEFIWYGVTFSGNAYSSGLIKTADTGGSFTCHGCDFSALAGDTLLDLSDTGAYNGFHRISASRISSTTTLTDNYQNYMQNRACFSGVDEDGASEGETYWQECISGAGIVTTNTSTYNDAGLQFSDGSTPASIKFEPTAHSQKESDYPLCSWLVYEWIDSTGSKTITTEVVENYTTAIQDDELWQEVFYLGTTNSTMWSIDSGQDIGAGSNLAAGTGLANWTGEPSGSRSVKLTSTVTVNKAGLYGVRYCLAKQESSKEVYVDADPTVS